MFMQQELLIFNPTSENRATAAKSIGLGLQVNSVDKYFFNKNVSAKLEYSKNWQQ